MCMIAPGEESLSSLGSQAEAERARFFALSLNLLCIAGFDGYFKQLNPMWEQTFGYTNGELLAHPYLDFVHPDDRASTAAVAQDVAQGHVVRAFQNRYRCKDGSYKWLFWNAIPLPDQQLIYATARDITKRKRTERDLVTEHAVTRVLAESVTLSETTPKILQAICEGIDWKLGAFWNVDAQANLLRCIGIWPDPDVQVAEFSSVTGVMTFPPGIGLPGRVWASGKAAWISDIMVDTNFPRMPFAKESGLHGAFGFPVSSGPEVIGVIEFFSREIQSPDDDLLQMMSALGNQIG